MSTKDDVYAYALSKSLTKVSSPMTVGLYSSCPDRINMLLRCIEAHLEQEALKMEREYRGRSRPRPVKGSFNGFLALIGRLLFYKPVWTEENLQRTNVRFLHVHFSAWHFAGSDLLWAGLVLRLFQAMQLYFGKLPLALYRALQYREEDIVKQKVVENNRDDWRSKKLCCCPLWLLLLFVLLIIVVSVVLLVLFGFPKPEVENSEREKGTATAQVGVLEGLVIASLGVPAAGAVRFIFQVAKSLIFNPNSNIRWEMNNRQVSNQLGFMNEVRKEMWLLGSFIHFVELVERRKIRVVLSITNLDRCSPKSIVSVLDAINILLSDMESPFISILAVNPEVIVQKVNFADGCFCKDVRARAFLNRIVTLAFTIPPLADMSKDKVFYSLISQLKMAEDVKEGGHKLRDAKGSRSSLDGPLMEKGQPTRESTLPLIDKSAAASELREETQSLIISAFESILNRGKLNKYILDDAMSMRRVVNSIQVSVTVMKALKMEMPLPEHIAAWVVLANHWPCRLSWILQCLEDNQQRSEIDENVQAITDESKTLWEIFTETRSELYVIREQIDELLDEDTDDDMFEMFLKIDFPFTVKDMDKFKPATVNLDHTIRKEMGRIRRISRLKDSGWMRNIAPLQIKTIMNMNVEDVCTELEKMKFPHKYAKIVIDNDLDGPSLVFGDTEDLKTLLKMTFGEWTTFRLHFLGFPSHTDVKLIPNHVRKQLSPLQHFNPHHSPAHSSDFS